MKVISISAMHGRQEVVEYCLNKMPWMDKYMVYSDDIDGDFLLNQFVSGIAKVPNWPLSNKWNMAIQALRNIDFDAVIILGSDDYIDLNTYSFIQKNMNGNDVIGFTDIYFEKSGRFYYWEGYSNYRTGEPIGAGRVYSKSFLEKIEYNLYPHVKNKGLDLMAWGQVIKHNAKRSIYSIKENGLTLVDVKNGGNMNSLEKLMRSLTIIPV